MNIFISHAWEDKESIARPLAKALKKIGFSVWFDEFSLNIGSSLSREIDRGLNICDYGIVILSKSFFSKPWPQRELAGLIAKETENKSGCGIILPIWHQIEASYIRQYSPILADRVAISTSQGIEKIVSEIRQAILKMSISNDTKNIERIIKPSVVHIPACEFIMGTDDKQIELLSFLREKKEEYSKEQPQHKVFIDDFYIGKYLVTNSEYIRFVIDSKIRPPLHWDGFQLPENKEDHPVVNISWNDAIQFCEWLSKKTGCKYRLPTEAEWEKAARGKDGRIFPWGNEWDHKKTNSGENSFYDTTPIGYYSPIGDSPYGVVDMVGNVWEWCSDWYDKNEYLKRSEKVTRNPQGPKEGIYRVHRGGAFDDRTEYIRCSARGGREPYHTDWFLGFRVALEIQTIK